uniref:Reverse transcriptase domain-containing protein n=1 Tax=Strongyloides venezuelensis TaxID=75913 RepID=A0A0K0FPL2_STRVS
MVKYTPRIMEERRIYQGMDKRGIKSPWTGPFVVVKLDQHQRVLIKKGRHEQWCHVSQLKKFQEEKPIEGKNGNVDI